MIFKKGIKKIYYFNFYIKLTIIYYYEWNKDNSNLDLNNSNKHILNFSTFALKLIEEINIVRRFPASYSKKLQNIMQNYEGNILTAEEYGIKTKEGKKDCKKQYHFLNRLKLL